MPQTKLDIQISELDRANEIKEKGGSVAGVKFINVNLDNCIVVTHSEDFDEEAFKQATGL